MRAKRFCKEYSLSRLNDIREEHGVAATAHSPLMAVSRRAAQFPGNCQATSRSALIGAASFNC
jgi:hypothetical protein